MGACMTQQARKTRSPPLLAPCLHRWMRDARELRLQRRVQRMRLQSDSAQLQREIVQLQHQLHAESKTQQSLEQQLRDCQRARLAGSASLAGQWQLGAVQLYHNRVVQAAPVRVSASSLLSWLILGHQVIQRLLCTIEKGGCFHMHTKVHSNDTRCRPFPAAGPVCAHLPIHSWRRSSQSCSSSKRCRGCSSKRSSPASAFAGSG